MTDTPLLQCEGLTKEFGGLTAVDDVDISLESGLIYSLIGPNGAGKTTTFNMIAGLLQPTAGTIAFNGRDITSKSQHDVCQLGIARTFQTPRPFTSQTVLENVTFAQQAGSGTYDRAKALEVLDFVGLGDKAELSAGELTVVQQKRLDLARALATDPELLLLDEIMAGLNPSEMDDFLALIREINKERSVFVIEHIMDAIMDISDRIIVLQNGQRIAEGTPEEVSSNDNVIKAYLGEEFVEHAQG
ncbi:ABC transporter ATP-binding protein [Natrinema sp. 1APR25-10V2]|uniref:ABC transporter ATP-binding protein n=1 Tax=Natrinema sp. 1APR25-10V2 TaxID=2951081 RepID=UPI0028745683|nr:ABC transporter ATP-binding protein [Natrinema sp. 1APR25-10V2]MDS0476954.1 ABC transporter ATP-binding protein [Natrinema sp. 1APR25-10V2]